MCNRKFLILIFVIISCSNAQNLTPGGCEIGWTLWNDNCYRVVDTQTFGVTTTTMTFDEALDYCRSNGANLASITSAFENAFIQKNLSLVQNFRYWIGLQVNDQNIFWIDGTPYTYTNLNTSTVIPGEFMSVYITPGQKWIAGPSDLTLEGRICKKPSNPKIPPFKNGSALGFMQAHDPTFMKTQDGQYFCYMTNDNIPASISLDKKTFALNGTAFPNGLPWTDQWTHGQRCTWTFDKSSKEFGAEQDCLWAPDIHYKNGQYYMYYAASYFGSKVSAIGLATSKTGRPGEWTDHAQVFNSTAFSFNAIDPDLLVDDDGTWYLVFGSWSSGIWQYIMDPSTGFIKAGETPVQLTNGRPHGIEGSGMWKHGQYYYLQASIGVCCQGIKSTYQVIIGRSTNPRGSFVDKAGTPMLNGGGSDFLVSVYPMVGPGGAFTFKDTDGDYFVYHYYDVLNNGKPRLAISNIGYSDDGWPYVY